MQYILSLSSAINFCVTEICTLWEKHGAWMKIKGQKIEYIFNIHFCDLRFVLGFFCILSRWSGGISGKLCGIGGLSMWGFPHPAGSCNVVPSWVLTHVLHSQRELYGGTSGLCAKIDIDFIVFVSVFAVTICLLPP